MEKKILRFINKGMSRDLSISKTGNELAFENYNIRITPNKDNSLLSVNNERGTAEIDNVKIKGTVIGYCVLNDKMVIFSTVRQSPDSYITEENPDTILLVSYDNTAETFNSKTLYSGNLGLCIDYPIETLGNIETESIKKVYWIDGLHQTRFINIEADENEIESWKSQTEPFGIMAELNLEETVAVSRISDGIGQFPSGSIQYFITYSNYFGVETPIVYQTDLYWLTADDRALSPEEYQSVCMKIEISGIDTKFDRLNLYSIIRTTYNGTPEGRLVQSININNMNSVSIIDTGLSFTSIDASSLLYKGGDWCIPSAMTQKDGVLFLGNFKIGTDIIDDDIQNKLKSSMTINWISKQVESNFESSVYYNFNYQDTNVSEVTNPKIFKTGEWYKFGLQLQNIYGKWTQPIALTELQVPSFPQYSDGKYSIQLPSLNINVSTELYSQLYKKGYRKCRVVMAERPYDSIIAQGIVCPTVFKTGSRYDGSAYAQSSWFIRPGYIGLTDNSNVLSDSSLDYIYGQTPECRHNYIIPEYGQNFLSNPSESQSLVNEKYPLVLRSEVQSNWGTDSPIGPYIDHYTYEAAEIFNNKYHDSFFVDTETVTFHSPDIDENTIFNGEYKFRIVGYADITSEMGAKFLSVESVTGEDSAFNNYKVKINIESGDDQSSDSSVSPIRTVISGPFWVDHAVNNNNDTITENSYGFIVFPWQKSGSIINDSTNTKAVLSSNITSNLHYSGYTRYVKSKEKIWTPARGISNPALFNSNENIPVLLENTDNKYKRILYKGNIDEVLAPKVIEQIPGTDRTGAEYPILGCMSIGGNIQQRTVGPIQMVAEYGDMVTDKKEIYASEVYRNIKDMGSVGVRMKYKSTPHAVFQFKKTVLDEHVILPGFKEDAKYFNPGNLWEFWNIDETVLKSEIGNYKIVSLAYMGNLSDYEGHSAVASGPFYTQIKSDYPDRIDRFNFIGIKTESFPEEYRNLPVDSVILVTGQSSSVEIVYNSALSFYTDTTFTSKINPPDSRGTYYFLTGTLLRKVKDDYLYDLNKYVELWEIVTLDTIYPDIEPSSIKLSFNGSYYSVSIDKSAVCYTAVEGSSDYGSVMTFPIEWLDWGENPDFETRVKFLQNNMFDPESYPIKNTYLYIGELYRDSNPFENIDNTQLNWTPCSRSTKIQNGFTVTLPCRGDTSFQRYDILKTIPYTSTEENSIVEIASVVLESRVNTNGRYDRNRGLEDNTSITSENFNLFNTVYNQKDNFYSTQILDRKLFSNTDFKNTVVWSLPKTSGAETDQWTQIILSNSIDLDGDKGAVNSLNRFGNSIIVFQDTGIAEIIYNPSIQLSTTQGLPIELANSNKVEGKRYLFNNTGCINKWSIVETSNGIYFIDDLSSSINMLSKSLVSLSDQKGFKDWININSSTLSWKPKSKSNFKGFYDKSMNDVYWSSKDSCIVYSELIQQFMSFMPYNDTSMIADFQNKLISEKNNRLWSLHEGPYNEFYGNIEPYYIEYRVTPDPYGDKLFTNIEYRSDMFDTDGNILNESFDTLTAETEYQYGVQNLEFNKTGQSSLKRKFRIWRADIPRDSKNEYNRFGLNRIRNPWVKLRLTKNNTDNNHNYNVFHDMSVYYFE